MTGGLKTGDFDFDLPEGAIADRPAVPREAARLLEVGAALGDRTVAELPGLFRAGDVLAINDTKVIPARIVGRRGQARIEATLLRPLDRTAEGETWSALARPARRLRAGDVIEVSDSFRAHVEGRAGDGEIRLRFAPGTDVLAALEDHGEPPLPPYIKRPGGADARDRADYQTVYARAPGAVAAPTAGLHLTRDLLARIAARGVGIVAVTLHVGAGTFLPVKSERIEHHRMHAEWGEISPAAAQSIRRGRAAGGRVIAAGTTSLRLLESAADETGRIEAFRGDTELFIVPGYRFRIVDALLTNFHLPRSTLFMLVAAFSGLARMKSAYAHAAASGYRFYSYGDATFLHRAETGLHHAEAG